jgi:hypothetical protein
VHVPCPNAGANRFSCRERQLVFNEADLDDRHHDADDLIHSAELAPVLQKVVEAEADEGQRLVRTTAGRLSFERLPRTRLLSLSWFSARGLVTSWRGWRACLVFRCCRTEPGWADRATGKQLAIAPTHIGGDGRAAARLVPPGACLGAASSSCIRPAKWGVIRTNALGGGNSWTIRCIRT